MLKPGPVWLGLATGDSAEMAEAALSGTSQRQGVPTGQPVGLSCLPRTSWNGKTAIIPYHCLQGGTQQSYTGE